MIGDRRSLKILHVDPESAWGGGEVQVIGLIERLSLGGHHNTLLCRPGSPVCREARKRDVPVLPLTMRSEMDLRPIFSLRRRLRRERYDIVHFHTKRAHALSLWVRGASPRTGFVVTRRMDYRVRRNWYNHVLYNVKVDAVVAISKKIAEVLVEGGVGSEKIRVIHSGIEPAKFRAVTNRPDGGELAVGTVAVLEERKGHRFLLEAAALLKRRGQRLQYRFAGAGSEMSRLKALTAQLGLEAEVVFMDFVTDVPSFLSSVDLLVLPSLYEGLGVAVLEAMAAAKPVVATQVGGLPELIEDRVTGFLVPPANAEALAGAISPLARDKSLLQEMGQRGRERVEKYFSIEQMAKKNEALYYEILQGFTA